MPQQLCKHFAALTPKRKRASRSWLRTSGAILPFPVLVHVSPLQLAEEYLRIHRHSLELTRLLYRPGQDSGNKRFETRITTQGIEKRFDLDEVDIEIVVIASRLFQPIQRMILFAKRQVDHGKSVCWHVARLGLFGQL